MHFKQRILYRENFYTYTREKTIFWKNYNCKFHLSVLFFKYYIPLMYVPDLQIDNSIRIVNNSQPQTRDSSLAQIQAD